MRVRVPIRPGARTEAHWQSAAVKQALGDGRTQLTAVLVAHHRFGRYPVDRGGDGPRHPGEACARIVVPAPADGLVGADLPGQFVPFPPPALRRRESGEAPVAETSGQVVPGVAKRCAVAVGHVVVNPHGTWLPDRMELRDAREVGDQLRVSRARQPPRGESFCGDHRAPVLSRAVAGFEDVVGMADDGLYLDGRHNAHPPQVRRRFGTLPRMLFMPAERRKAHPGREPDLVEGAGVLLQCPAHRGPLVRIRVPVAEPEGGEWRAGRRLRRGHLNRRPQAEGEQSGRHAGKDNLSHA